MATNEIWQLSVIGTVSSQQHIHTLHFKEVPGTLLGTDLITNWTTSAMTQYRACFAIGQNPVQLIRAQKVCGNVPLPAADEVVPAVGSQTGTRPTSSSEALPSFVASLVSLKGMYAGRRYQGRFFLGGMLEIDTNENNMGAPYTALVQAYCDALRAAYVTPGVPAWRLFNFSRLLAYGDPNHTKAGLPDPIAPVGACQLAGSDVTNLIVSNRPTTMRSRKLGHGL